MLGYEISWVNNLSRGDYYSTVLHSIGVVLSIIAVVLRGFGHPAIGFPIAIGILAGFGLLSSPHTTDTPEVLRTISGGPTTGGKKQGATIKHLFAVALLYAALSPALTAFGEPSTTDMLLGFALFSSSIGTALEAKEIDRRLADSEISGN
jgi:hypothetical protein